MFSVLIFACAPTPEVPKPAVEEDPIVEDPTFVVAWTDEAVTITLSGGSPPYGFGIADTDPGNPVPWTGEDCFEGYTATTGTNYLYCHELAGELTTLTYGGDWSDLETGTTNLEISDGATATYLLLDGAGCWVDGFDIGYYDGLDCEILED